MVVFESLCCEAHFNKNAGKLVISNTMKIYRKFNDVGAFAWLRIFLITSIILIAFLSCENGIFQKDTQVLNGYISYSVLVDVDGDGDLDLLADACCEETTSLPLLLNDGAGNFTLVEDALPDRTYGYFGQSNNIQPGDYNQDGHVDLLIHTQDADYTKSEIQLFLGRGDGTFSDASDLIPDGSFTDAGGEMFSADFDGDGKLDFLVTGYLFGMEAAIYLQDEGGLFNRTFELRELYPGATPDWFGNALVWVGDLDNDGDPDIVPNILTNGSGIEPYYVNRWLSYRNTSSPGGLSFEPIDNGETFEDHRDDSSSNNPREKGNGAMVDVNGDGFLDLLTGFGMSGGGSGLTTFLAYLNDGTGRLLFNDEILNGLDPDFEHAVFNYSIADFDGNGLDDVFIADHGFDAAPFPGHRNYLLMNFSSGLEDWTEKSLSLEKTFTHGACVGDVNGDGYPDLFMNNSNDELGAVFEERLWINNGDGTFRPSRSGI